MLIADIGLYHTLAIGLLIGVVISVGIWLKKRSK
jgi:hypothetical protein